MLRHRVSTFWEDLQKKGTGLGPAILFLFVDPAVNTWRSHIPVTLNWSPLEDLPRNYDRMGSGICRKKRAYPNWTWNWMNYTPSVRRKNKTDVMTFSDQETRCNRIWKVSTKWSGTEFQDILDDGVQGHDYLSSDFRVTRRCSSHLSLLDRRRLTGSLWSVIAQSL